MAGLAHPLAVAGQGTGMKTVPYSCKPCRESGWPTGMLLFPGQETPICKWHGVPFERSRYFDENGERLLKPIADAPSEEGPLG